jgi:4-hydroxy-4-methyl-2-oxoglutarate aldolase
MSRPAIDPAETTRVEIERPSSALIAEAAGLPTATLHEAGGRIGALPAAIKPVDPAMALCGAALTVHSPAGDNLWIHRALYVAQPGDVLVVFTSDGYDWGYWGEILSTAAMARGLGGLVIDACVRDGVLLGGLGFPVFARGLNIRGTGKDFGARGWINAPIIIGDIVIHPGDLIVGDGDGVVAIPRLQAAEVIAASHAREAKEALVMERLKAGESSLSIYGWE